MNKAQICAQGDRKEPGALKAGAGTGMVLPWLLPLNIPSTTFKLGACSLVSPFTQLASSSPLPSLSSSAAAAQKKERMWLVPAPAGKSWNGYKDFHHGMDLGA